MRPSGLLYLMLRDKDRYTQNTGNIQKPESDLMTNASVILRASELLLRENEKEKAQSLLTYFKQIITFWIGFNDQVICKY